MTDTVIKNCKGIIAQTKIFVAGHRGLVGSAIARRLKAGGCSNLVLKTRDELDLLNQYKVLLFLLRRLHLQGYPVVSNYNEHLS